MRKRERRKMAEERTWVRRGILGRGGTWLFTLLLLFLSTFSFCLFFWFSRLIVTAVDLRSPPPSLIVPLFSSLSLLSSLSSFRYIYRNLSKRVRTVRKRRGRGKEERRKS